MIFSKNTKSWKVESSNSGLYGLKIILIEIEIFNIIFAGISLKRFWLTFKIYMIAVFEIAVNVFLIKWILYLIMSDIKATNFESFINKITNNVIEFK